MTWQIALALLVGFLAGFAAAALAGAHRRARLRLLRDGVAELSRGNLAHRVLIPGDDDVARAAEDLNEFADAVQGEREAATARDAAQKRLLANISHDLRTPIASVAGYVDALQRGLGDDPDRYLAIVAEKTEEMAELTDDLFYQARLDSGDLELKTGRLDLAEAVRRAVLGFEHQLASRGVDVRVEIPEEECPVEADASAVARILGNLISNALRHAEDMTTLSVTMTEIESAPDSGERAAARYVVRLTNDGARLPQDVERLFARGAAGAGGGTGLGLAIARELADRMGASVSVEHSGPQVATFALTLPKAAHGS